MKVVNLARRPFENTRPVVRTAAILWLVGGGLLVLNLWLYWSHYTGFSETRNELATVRAQITARESELDRLEKEVQGLDLGQQNQRVAFLNYLIAKRIFPWSRLFERLERVLPDNVRLNSVVPEVEEIDFDRAPTTRRNSRSRRGRSTASRAVLLDRRPDEVVLQLSGVAGDDDALLDFLDLLYDDPAFRRPVLASERRDPANNSIVFSLDTVFLTDVATAPPDETVAVLDEEAEAGEVGGLAGMPEDEMAQGDSTEEGDEALLEAAAAATEAPVWRTPPPVIRGAEEEEEPAVASRAVPEDEAEAAAPPRPRYVPGRTPAPPTTSRSTPTARERKPDPPRRILGQPSTITTFGTAPQTAPPASPPPGRTTTTRPSTTRPPRPSVSRTTPSRPTASPTTPPGDTATIPPPPVPVSPLPRNNSASDTPPIGGGS